MSNNHFSKNHFEKEIVTLGRTNPVLNVANDTGVTTSKSLQLQRRMMNVTSEDWMDGQGWSMHTSG